MSRSVAVGLACAAVSASAWAALFVVAVCFPGGHPPLAAYVAIPVLLGALPVNGIGLVAGAIGLRASAGRRGLAWLALAANALPLALAAVKLAD